MKIKTKALVLLILALFLLAGCGGTSSSSSSDDGEDNEDGGGGNSSYDPRLVTGFPDQNSFSIAAETLNPEAYNYNNVDVAITVNVGDRYNNPVPEGTDVFLVAEGGLVSEKCESDKSGACAAIWTSTGPRPADGRATVLAFSEGEESFTDVNSNGFFDPPDRFDRTSDVGEAYIDANENGNYDFGEEYFDFNNDGRYTPKNGIYNGTLCSDVARDAGLCQRSLVQVHDSITITMSGSFFNIDFSPDEVDLRGSSVKMVRVSLYDRRNQPPPAETKIKVETTNGTILGEAEFAVPNTNYPGPIVFSISVGATADDEISTGYLTVTATTPFGNVSSDGIPVYD